MELTFFTFKNDYDLNQLKETGRISEPDNLCENFLFDILNKYTGKNGIVWFWASFDGLVLNSYMDNKYRIQFKAPKDYILLTPERFKYLSEDILDKYDKELEGTLTSEEGCERLFECTDIVNYIEKFIPSLDETKAFNPDNVLPVPNLFMGIMPELKEEDIIKIELVDNLVNKSNTKEINYFK